MKTYSKEAILSELQYLNQWQFIDGAIEKKYKFLNFTQAIEFIVQVAVEAEMQKHHPEFFNIYNKVTLRLNTHDVGGVTEKDFDLAKAIDGIELP